MKYAKQLAQDLLKIPVPLQDVSISYKQWKKRCKQVPDVCAALQLLVPELQRVEQCFLDLYKKWAHPRPMLLCFTKDPISCNNQDLLLFANMNATTVYKVCKRIQKTFHTDLPMQWLVATRAAHVFSILGGCATGHLQLTSEPKTKPECPICMEEERSKKNPMMVFGCGHYACQSCSLRYAGVSHLNGTWSNVIAYASKKECPICHFKAALMTTVAIT